MRCKHITSSGRQCARNVELGYLCPNHLRAIHGLSIQQSRIPGAGYGLFATRHFAEDDLIIPYEGRVMDETEFDAIYTTANKPSVYVVYDEYHNVYIDASEETSSVARFANAADHPLNTRHNTSPNAGLDLDDHGNVALYAIRRIGEGTEIIWNYGGEYKWF